MRASRIFAFGANDALRQRGRGRQERAGDLLRRQAMNFAQRERNLRVRRQRRMTNVKIQAQPIVLDTLLIVHSTGATVATPACSPVSSSASIRAPAHRVNRLEAADTSQARGFAGTPSCSPVRALL